MLINLEIKYPQQKKRLPDKVSKSYSNQQMPESLNL